MFHEESGFYPSRSFKQGTYMIRFISGKENSDYGMENGFASKKRKEERRGCSC